MNSTFSKFVNFIKQLPIFRLKLNNPDNTMSVLVPPVTVKGMTELDKSAFKKVITVPCIQIESSKIGNLKRCFRSYLLKLENYKPMDVIEGSNPELKRILFNPTIKSLQDFKENDREQIEQLGFTNEDFKSTDIEVGYEQWRGDDILKAVLPSDKDSLTSYSRIGHIVHVNLREHLLPYKQLIGQVLLEKVQGAKTVVNKIDAIDNTYRNFQMEVLSGESDLKATVRENHCSFELDFGLVYWNPRLCTEHERIVKLLKRGDILYDVFAGIGPFSVPAAKIGATVLANDLNPESYKWLTHNIKLNKVKTIEAFNKDGREFILNELKEDLIKRWQSKFTNTIHITMNLPALATTFLNSFQNLLPNSLSHLEGPIPKVHVYCFVKDFDPEQSAVELVETDLGSKLGEHLIEVKMVRKVSSSKNMMRVSFNLSKEILFEQSTSEEPPTKKLCTKGKKLRMDQIYFQPNYPNIASSC